MLRPMSSISTSAKVDSESIRGWWRMIQASHRNTPCIARNALGLVVRRQQNVSVQRKITVLVETPSTLKAIIRHFSLQLLPMSRLFRPVKRYYRTYQSRDAGAQESTFLKEMEQWFSFQPGVACPFFWGSWRCCPLYLTIRFPNRPWV